MPRFKRMMRELQALGLPPFTPTDDQRRLVQVLAFNGVDEERIAQVLEITPVELAYHFRKELNYSDEMLQAMAASTVIELSQQRQDLGVALRAAQAMLTARNPRWREPKADLASEVPRIESMTLAQVEAEIARLERQRRTAADSQAETEATAHGQGQPH